MVNPILLSIGGVAALYGLFHHLKEKPKMRVNAVQCDNPGCTKMDRADDGQKAPYGWYLIRVKQVGITGKVIEKCTCSTECLIALVTFSTSNQSIEIVDDTPVEVKR